MTARWSSSSYWQSICPELKISDEGRLADAGLYLDRIQRQQFRVDGYTSYESLVPSPLVDSLKTGISQLKAAGELPISIFLFDEAWDWVGIQSTLAAQILEAPIKMLPDFWAWCLEPGSGDQGWEPHRDKLVNVIREDGSANAITVWTAIGDATPENGCMYMLPASKDPYYPKFPYFEIENLQFVRALPASSGTSLLWDQNVLHWGGTVSEWATHPRISMAVEYQRADAVPFNEPLLDPFFRPMFSERLQLVAKQCLQYNHIGEIPDSIKEAAAQVSG